MVTIDAGLRRVAVVHPDPWVRRGVCARLDEHDRVRAVGAATAEAMADPGALAGADLVLLEPFDPEGFPDRLAGVGLVEALLAEQPLLPVHVLTSRGGDPLLRARAAEAGAAGVHDLASLDEDDVVALAAGAWGSLGSLDPRSLRAAAGLEPDGSINEYLAALVRAGDLAAFDPDTTQQGSGIPRRRSIRLRHDARTVAGLRGADRGPRAPLPSWREVRTFVNRARALDSLPAGR